MNRHCPKCPNEKTQAPVINGIAWVVPRGAPGGKPRPVRVSSPTPLPQQSLVDSGGGESVGESVVRAVESDS